MVSRFLFRRTAGRKTTRLYLFALFLFLVFLSTRSYRNKTSGLTGDSLRKHSEAQTTAALLSPSLSLDVWAPLVPRDTGLSELALHRCYFPPFFAGNLCSPPSTQARDVDLGRWVKVERDLNLEGRFWSGWVHMYYRRTQRADISLITDLLLLEGSQLPTNPHEWVKLGLSVRSGTPRLPPLYLWYKLGKTGHNMTTKEKANIIAELDVLYGEDVPWYGFEKIKTPVLPVGRKFDATWITFRRGATVLPHVPPLRFSPDGKFKILQIADLHYSVARVSCRDSSIQPCPSADDLTHSFASRVIDIEKPDLIVFSGDQLNGQYTAWDAKSIIAKFSKLVVDRRIPWVAIFGNHDAEDGVSKEAQMAMYEALPYNMVQSGPKDVDGIGNYVLKVYSPDSLKDHLLTLYLLDSGDYIKGRWDWTRIHELRSFKYDYIRQSQIDWFLNQSAAISERERPFKPASSLPRSTSEATWMAKPNGIMFFHTPLPQFKNEPDVNPLTGKVLDVGSYLEPPAHSLFDAGFFQKGLLVAKEGSHGMSKNIPEIKVVGNGHDHINDNCRRIQGIWFCYGGASGYAGYSQVGFDRRFRVYDISDYGETIRTYKRTDKDEILDDMYVAGAKAPPFSES
ncbi:Metallo-dependent phosphatase-like protein [Crepidotus variabilis]|uniref:Metallo-dependent phosphatase-like protein n=1 Tax=Crepidotus variabilis TaxID=179855 RepID=A0A9P6EPM6_9AGAR|nr:Metallo-dependent phosphatase-like protein [Crepidotus variabilis]